MGSAFKKTASFGKASRFAKTAGGLREKLKNLSKKDMAFVGIGLSILVMAPVAEYLMSKPGADNLLSPGFGGRERGAGVYEPGINGLSQGSADGSGEVITPLSARDPMSLILGSQPTPPPPAPSAPPDVGMRDAVAGAGRAAFSQATKSAGAPTPIPRMQSTLRSFGSFFSGGESSRSSGGLNSDKVLQDAQNASRKAAARSMVGPVGMAGYKGVASTPNSSSRDAFEKLRSKADKSAGNFTGGNASDSLDRAAADALELGRGASGMGAGGDSEKIRPTSNSTNKNEHNFSGETLDQMAAKSRLQNQLAWEEYLKHGIAKEILGSIIQNVVIGGVIKPMGDLFSGTMSQMLGLNPPSPPANLCWVPKVGTTEKDCINGVVGKKIGVFKDKDGKPTCPTCSACVCGYGPEALYGPAAAGAPNASGGGGTPTAPTPVVKVDSPPQEMGNFDAQLTMIWTNVKTVEDNLRSKSDPAAFARGSAKIAETVADITALHNDTSRFPWLAQKAFADLESYNDRKYKEFSEKVVKTDSAISDAAQQADNILAKIAAADVSVKVSKLVKEKGATAKVADSANLEAVNSDKTPQVTNEVKSWLKEKKELAQTYKQSLDKPRLQNKFCSRAAAFYAAEYKATSGMVKTDLLDGSLAISKSAGDLKKDFLKTVDDTNKTVNIADLKVLYKNLIGRDAPLVTLKDAPSDGPTPSEKSLRDAVADGSKMSEKSLLDQIFDKRGANIDAYWKSNGKVDDSAIRKSEPDNWLSRSPKAMKNNLDAAFTNPELTQEQKNIVVAGIRAVNLLPADTDDVGSLAVAAESAVTGVTALLNTLNEEVDKYLKTDAGAAPYTGATAPPAVGTTAPTVGITAPPAVGTTAPAAGTTAPAVGTTAPAVGTTAPQVAVGSNISAAKKEAIDNANDDLKNATRARKLAEIRNDQLQTLQPKKGKEKQMKEYKKKGADAVTDIKEGEKAITDSIKGINGCTTEACVKVKKIAIANQKQHIKDRGADLEAAYDAADKIKKTGQGNMGNTPPSSVPAGTTKPGQGAAHNVPSSSASAAKIPAPPGSFLLSEPNVRQRILLSKIANPNPTAPIFIGEYSAPFTVGAVYSTRVVYTYSATCVYDKSARIWQVENASRTETKYRLNVGMKDWKKSSESSMEFTAWKRSKCGK